MPAADVQNAPAGRHARQPDPLQDREGDGVELLVPVAIVEPREIVVEGHGEYSFSMAY